jgi:hypothetical protein
MCAGIPVTLRGCRKATTDLGEKPLVGNQGEENSFVVDQKVSFATEARRETNHCVLYVGGVRAAPEQKTP